MTLERLVAALLWWGTLGASSTIALGLVLHDLRVVSAGIVAFIALPAARVAIMVFAFARARDARAAAIATGVLLVLVAGFVLGLATRV